jgi:hypothetical protein
MEKDVLSQVIEVEKEIQRCFEAEKLKVREWLEIAKKESQQEVLLEEKRIKQALEQSSAEAAKEAEIQAAEITREAAAAAERLAQLKTERLTVLTERQIMRILPEYDHDSQDVKG